MREDYGLGFENLYCQFGNLIKQHRFYICRGKDLGFVERFIVGITEEE